MFCRPRYADQGFLSVCIIAVVVTADATWHLVARRFSRSEKSNSNKFSASSDSWLRLRKGNNIYSICCHPDLDLFANAVSASLVDLILPQFLDLVPSSV
jgi:hypothetical protein